MAVMDPCTFELLSGPPLPVAFSGCGNQPTTEFDDAFLRAIAAFPPLPPAHFAPTPVHQAAVLHYSIEFPATCELYAAALDAHVVHPAVEVPVTDSLELPATCELYAAALDAHLDHPAVEVSVTDPIELPATCELYAAAIDAHLVHPAVEASVTDSLELPATCELYAAALDAHLVHPSVEVPVTDSFELPATCELYAAALDAHLVHPSVEVPVTDSYDADIDVNLRELEKNAKQRPSPDYLKTLQGDRMIQSSRAKIVFWMGDLTAHFDLAPGTLHRAVSYVDRVLSERILSPAHMEEYELRLLGATAVYTAAKYEERCTRFKVNAAGIAECCGFATSKEVIDMERDMLATLRYELGGPTAYTFVEHFTRHSKGGEQDLEVRQLAHHLAERSLLDYRSLQILPSAVAASAVFLARLILNPTSNQVRQWNEDFEELTGYKHTDLVLGIQTLYIMNPDPRFAILPAFFQDE